METITWRQYDRDARTIARDILSDNKKFKAVLGIKRGGLILAVHLSHLLGIPLIDEYDEQSLDILICDDVSDTGKTLANLGFDPQQVATLYRKDGTIFEPRYYSRTINAYINFPWEY